MNVGILLSAQSVAMAAMVNDVDPLSVDDLRNRAEELLERDDDLRQAVTYFAIQYEICRYEPEELARQGRRLFDAVSEAAGPPRRVHFRADIDG